MNMSKAKADPGKRQSMLELSASSVLSMDISHKTSRLLSRHLTNRGLTCARILCAYACLFLFVSCALSATWYVAPDGDDGAAGTSWGTALLTIGTGVSKASAPDTVLVSNGVYMLPGEVWVSKGITIRSVNGRDVTIVNGNNPATGSRCITLNHTNAVLDGFTMTNGVANIYGGGVYVAKGSVYNCTMSGNQATNSPSGGYGGGVHVAIGVITNCIIRGNTVARVGGGVSMNNAEAKVQNCTIADNVATQLGSGTGGGIWMSAGAVSNCVISGNSCDWYGSGVYMQGGTVTDCVISNNACGARGAAVYMGAGGIVKNSEIINNTSSNWGAGVNLWLGNSGTLSNCVISGNVCEDRGGGMLIYGGCDSAVLDCVISNNTAASGGGFYINGDDALIENCVIADNLSFSSQGGGVYGNNTAHPVFRNCLLAGNRATNSHGGGLCVGPAVIENCTVVSNSCRMDPGFVGGGMRSSINGTVIVNSILYHNSSGTGSSSNYVINAAPVSFSNCCFAPALTGSSTNISTNNITSNPLLRGDYRLVSGAPPVNAGVNQDWMTNSLDLDGRPRIKNGVVDMGSYEFIERGTVFRVF